MKQLSPKAIMYRVFQQEGGTKFWLTDVIAHDNMEHPLFSTEYAHAMTFRSFNTANQCRQRLINMGYHPHIE